MYREMEEERGGEKQNNTTHHNNRIEMREPEKSIHPPILSS
jgi:hypothetical protein